ncbi:MAG TPA: right-handed parallel beta-helix repeat-containing protein [Phycisphaerae bacterium]|nr:right-handed parallel beta-helix repeat-containing protein [Phycisphaerae bacterium]HNU45451.1 right-handed parallel beta-helix repeat-containing protein [Phycisphaerae bacterium]
MPRARAGCPCDPGENCWWVAPPDAQHLEGTGTGTYQDPFRGIEYALNHDNVQDDDVILALPGEYYECRIELDNDARLKRLTLRSCSGPAFTTIRPKVDCEQPIFFLGDAVWGGYPIVEGFTITGATCSGWVGGAFNIQGCHPTIRQNVITGNTAQRGGAIYCHNASPMLWDNIISYSTATDGEGGALYCNADSWPTIAWSTFACNETTAKGGAIRLESGAKPPISHCVFASNKAVHGGAVYQGAPYQCEGERAPCQDEGVRGPIIDNCVFTQNVAGENLPSSGGALDFRAYAQPTLANCIISGNRTTGGGGGVHAYYACVYVHNTILWGNRIAGDGQAGTQNDLHLTNGATAVFRYSDVDPQFITSDVPTPDVYYEGVNRGIDPEFRDPLVCDYRLDAASIVIDAADDCDAVSEGYDVDGDQNVCTRSDLDDAERFVDDPAVQDVGLLCPGTCQYLEDVVDIGAYEFAATGCPEATIVGADPADGTIDARQPHPITDKSFGALQGIGGASEPIDITLSDNATGADNPGCWALCETSHWRYGRNFIESVTALGNGEYRLVLHRPITALAATTIQYVPDGSYVTYIAHPANVDAPSGSTVANANDITAIFNCVNNPPTCTLYQADTNHSGGLNLADVTREIDLLNGAGQFDPWFGTLLPDIGDCPSGVPCSCAATAPGGGESGGEDGEAFGEALIGYLTFIDLDDPPQATAFPEIVQGFLDLAGRALNEDERHEAACALLDPGLAFISSEVQQMVPQLVAALQE